jgi:hypothetical protein
MQTFGAPCTAYSSFQVKPEPVNDPWRRSPIIHEETLNTAGGDSVRAVSPAPQSNPPPPERTAPMMASPSSHISSAFHLLPFLRRHSQLTYILHDAITIHVSNTYRECEISPFRCRLFVFALLSSITPLALLLYLASFSAGVIPASMCISVMPT